MVPDARWSYDRKFVSTFKKISCVGKLERKLFYYDKVILLL